MLNSGFRGKRATDGLGAISAQNQLIQSVYPVPIITGYAVTDSSYVAIDDTAVTSGATVVVYGNNFVSGMTVYINNSSVSATYLDSTRITFTAPTLSNGTYVIYIITPQGGAAVLAPGIIYSGFPTWTTASYTASTTTLNIQLLATGDAPLTYSLQGSSVLPAGISLTSTGLLTGTTSVSVDSVYTFTVIVTDAQLQNTQQLITFSFIFGEPYWKYTTLLLSGETTVTPFISDASTNSFPVVILGDTKPTKFTPYSEGYYSNYFDGTGDSLVINGNAGPIGTEDFTWECWVYISTMGGDYPRIFESNTGVSGSFQVYLSSGTLTVGGNGTGAITSYSIASLTNQWLHLCITRTGSALRVFVNGVLRAYSASGGNNFPSGGSAWRTLNEGGGFVGYLSNMRVVRGSIVSAYSTSSTTTGTTIFTPPIVALTAISGTQFLGMQSSGFKDNSTNAFTITRSGDTTVNPSHPFATPTTTSYNALYSNYFDGSNSAVQFPANAVYSFDADFTIEAWLYLTSVSGASPQTFFSMGTGVATFDLRWYTTRWQISLNAGSGTDIGTTPAPVDNTWVHVAFVRSGSSIKVYVGGVASATTLTNATTLGSNSLTVNIGQSTTPSNKLTGYISNLRVVKGLAVYTGNFTPPTTTLQATQSSSTNISAITINQTVLLTCQDSRFIDNSSNAFTATGVGAAIPVAVSPFTMTTGTNTLTSLGSVYLDGTGDYLTVPNNTNLQFGTGDFTVECWIFATVVGAAQKGIIAKGTNTTGWELRIGGAVSGGLDFSYTSTGVTSATVVTINSWHHVALTRSGTSVKAFLDGVVVGSATTATDFSQTDDLKIGESRAGSQLFSGYISNVRILKGTALYTSAFLPPQSPLTAITNTQLLTVQYNGGANNYGIIDNGPFNNIITRNGNTSQGTFSPYSMGGWSNYFDGNGDYLSIPYSTSISQTSAYTLEFWFYPTYTYSGQYIFAQNGGGAFCLAWTGTIMKVDKNGVGIQITGTTTMSLNQWHHYAMTYDGTTTRVFANGALDGSVAGTGGLANVPTTIGYYAALGSSSYGGYISNLRFVSGTALYTSSFAPSVTTLSAISGTSLLTCQSNRLIDNSVNNSTVTKNGDVSVQAHSPFGSVIEATPLSYSNYFDGTGDYLSVATNAAFGFGTGDFTVEYWVYSTSWAAGPTVVDLRTGTLQFSDNYTTGGAPGVYYNATQQLTSSITISVNTWAHVAFTRSGTTMKIWVNGSQGATGTKSDDLQTTGTLRIGTNVSTVNYFTGYVSNVRIVKGTSLYTSVFTPSTTSLTAISGTSLLTCQSTTIIDNSTNTFTITANGDTKPSRINPFGYTTQNATSYTPSIHGGSIYLDGTTDYCVAPSIGTLSAFGTGDFTIEAWVYKADSAVQRAIIDTRDNSSVGALFYTTTNNKLNLFDGTSTWVSSTNTVPINQWAHVAAVRASGTTKLYINGIQEGSAADSRTYVTGSSGLHIGRQFGSTTNDWLGYISDIRIIKGIAIYTSNFLPPTAPLNNYSTSVPSSLLLNFNNGGIVDQHGTNVVEAVGNAQLSTSVKKYGSSSMYFDGTGDYLTIPTNFGFVFGQGDFTIECWFYIVSGSAGALFDTRSGATGVTPLLFFSSSLLRYYVNGGDQILSATTLSTSTWYHVALVRNSGSSKMYLNGVQTGSTYADTNNFTLTNTINIGRGNDNANVFNGYIDDLRITKGYARYTANFTAPTSAFVGQ